MRLWWWDVWGQGDKEGGRRGEIMKPDQTEVSLRYMQVVRGREGVQPKFDSSSRITWLCMCPAGTALSRPSPPVHRLVLLPAQHPPL